MTASPIETPLTCSGRRCRRWARARLGRPLHLFDASARQRRAHREPGRRAGRPRLRRHGLRARQGRARVLPPAARALAPGARGAGARLDRGAGAATRRRAGVVPDRARRRARRSPRAGLPQRRGVAGGARAWPAGCGWRAPSTTSRRSPIPTWRVVRSVPIREADLCFTVSEAARARRRSARSASTASSSATASTRGASPTCWRRACACGARAWARARRSCSPSAASRSARTRCARSAAFARLRARWPQARLWILGGATVLDHGAYRAEFERARDRLPAETRAAIVELGVVGEADVPALFAARRRAGDAVAARGVRAGRAGGAGRRRCRWSRRRARRSPSISTRRCAMLVDPLSEEAIAAGLHEALAASPARREAGRQRAEAHSWARVAARHAAALSASRRRR